MDIFFLEFRQMKISTCMYEEYSNDRNCNNDLENNTNLSNSLSTMPINLIYILISLVDLDQRD